MMSLRCDELTLTPGCFLDRQYPRFGKFLSLNANIHLHTASNDTQKWSFSSTLLVIAARIDE